jgi:hypothetical protein
MPEIPDDKWKLDDLCGHLQMAAFLEAWTIPYYMAAMFSIVDRKTLAYQHLQSVLHQEMLHLQLVANIANAYGYSPCLKPEWFTYDPDEVPYLKFDFTESSTPPAVSDPRDEYKPRSAALGPLDKSRVNTMCLIEFPDWSTGSQPAYQSKLTEYDSIGQFYDALEFGANQLESSPIVGGRRQVDMFSAFYRRLPRVTVDSSGDEGLAQVLMLLDVIRDQGEAAKRDDPIHRPNENTADDRYPTLSHYEKFRQIRQQKPLPKIYPHTNPNKYTTAQGRLERILIDNFANFIKALNALFAGNHPDDFVPLMVTLGANMLTCWRNGVTPKFTDASPLASLQLASPELASTGTPYRDFYDLKPYRSFYDLTGQNDLTAQDGLQASPGDQLRPLGNQ